MTSCNALDGDHQSNEKTNAISLYSMFDSCHSFSEHLLNNYYVHLPGSNKENQYFLVLI